MLLGTSGWCGFGVLVFDLFACVLVGIGLGSRVLLFWVVCCFGVGFWNFGELVVLIFISGACRDLLV